MNLKQAKSAHKESVKKSPKTIAHNQRVFAHMISNSKPRYNVTIGFIK